MRFLDILWALTNLILPFLSLFPNINYYICAHFTLKICVLGIVFFELLQSFLSLSKSCQNPKSSFPHATAACRDFMAIQPVSRLGV